MGLPHAASRYGASFGRPNASPNAPEQSGTAGTIVHIEIDNGGYDNGGAYWGLGNPLFMAFPDDDQGATHFFRAQGADGLWWVSNELPDLTEAQEAFPLITSWTLGAAERIEG